MTTSGPGSNVDPVAERDRHLQQLEVEIGATATDPTTLVRSAEQALTAARWAAAADGRDQRVIGLLQDTAQLTAAAALSMLSSHSEQSPLRGELMRVPPGLPRGALSTRHWIDGLWAATASGDAAMARRLARVDLSLLRPDARPGELELAQAMAGWWRSEEIGAFLIAALEVTDPSLLAESEIDHALDVVAPAIGVLRQLGDLDDAALERAFLSAGEAFVHYWTRRGAPNDPRRFVSLPLSALVRVAVDLRRSVRPISGVVPEVFAEPSGPELCCPVCDQPFDIGETSCSWCVTDLIADAPLELSIDRLLNDPGSDCSRCGRSCPSTALRCWNCRNRLR